jgi:hypothetical protein
VKRSVAFRIVSSMVAGLATALLALSCDRGPTVPVQARLDAPSRDISDAYHGDGNPRFRFLPPMVPARTNDGSFDASLWPIVDICVLRNGACATPLVATFTSTSGAGGQTLRVDAAEQQYVVNWNTSAFTLDLSATYRIRVRVVNTVLGYCDVRLVANGSVAKNATTGAEIVLVDGRTLPIKFRIDQGAVSVIGGAGGVATLNDGAVSLVIPPGALTSDAGISATPIAPGSTGAPDASVIGGTQYEFRPSPTTFSAPVQLTLSYPATLPPHVNAARLAICKMVENACQPLQGGTVNTATRTVSAPISGFSSYGVTIFPEMVYRLDGDFGQRPSSWLHSPAGEIRFPEWIELNPQIGHGSWTPDGSRFVYKKGGMLDSLAQPIASEMRVVNADGTGDRLLVADAGCPRVSLDGTRVLFGGANGLAIINIDGTAQNDFGSAIAGWCSTFRWIPNGRIGFRPVSGGIWTMNADGTDRRRIVDASDAPAEIAWSADGSKVAFRAEWANDLVGSGVYVVNADGSGLFLLVPTIEYSSGDAGSFEWSPIASDNRLVFQSCGWEYDGRCDGYTMYAPQFATGLWMFNADGSAATPLILAGSDQRQPIHPRWSPDGTRIAFDWPGIAWGGHSTFLINTNGSGLQLLVRENGAVGGHFGMWRP